jgi:5-methylcytosine-specific restriction endonuclease McrA
MNKTCKTCKKDFPATSEYFRPEKRVTCGLSATCLHCISLYNKEYRQREEVKKMHAEHQKEWAKNNKERVNGYNKNWKERNKEKVKIYKKKDYDTHTQSYKDRASKWYYEHADQAKASRREYGKKFRKTHKDMINTWGRNRRALLKESHGSHTVQDISYLYKAQKGKCFYCKKKLNNVYDVDHIIPISRGGANDKYNLVLSCSFCNGSKGSKLLVEWNRTNLLV